MKVMIVGSMSTHNSEERYTIDDMKEYIDNMRRDALLYDVCIIFDLPDNRDVYDYMMIHMNDTICGESSIMFYPHTSLQTHSISFLSNNINVRMPTLVYDDMYSVMSRLSYVSVVNNGILVDGGKSMDVIPYIFYKDRDCVCIYMIDRIGDDVHDVVLMDVPHKYANICKKVVCIRHDDNIDKLYKKYVHSVDIIVCLTERDSMVYKDIVYVSSCINISCDHKSIQSYIDVDVDKGVISHRDILYNDRRRVYEGDIYIHGDNSIDSIIQYVHDHLDVHHSKQYIMRLNIHMNDRNDICIHDIRHSIDRIVCNTRDCIRIRHTDRSSHPRDMYSTVCIVLHRYVVISNIRILIYYTI